MLGCRKGCLRCRLGASGISRLPKIGLASVEMMACPGKALLYRGSFLLVKLHVTEVTSQQWEQWHPLIIKPAQARGKLVRQSSAPSATWIRFILVLLHWMVSLGLHWFWARVEGSFQCLAHSSLRGVPFGSAFWALPQDYLSTRQDPEISLKEWWFAQL